MAALGCRTLLSAESLAEGESFEFAAGIPAIFLGVNKWGDFNVSAGGFVLALHKYDHGQRRRWYFIVGGERYYAQGHYRQSDGGTLCYSVHTPEPGTSVDDGEFDKYGSATAFAPKYVHVIYHRDSKAYQEQVAALLP
jgi:hypothetical protein